SSTACVRATRGQPASHACAPAVASSVLAENLEELDTRGLSVEEQAAVRRGHDLRARLLHTPHRHAEVLRLADHRDAGRMELLHQDVRNLAGEALLELQPTGVDLHHTRQLADADHAPPWDVADVEAAMERQQMVLTQ